MKISLLKVILVLSVLNPFFSCNDNHFSEEKNIKKKLDNANLKLEKRPDITLNITDTLLNLNSKDSLKKSDLLLIYQVRQKAFSKLKKLDSVLSSGEHVRDIAANIPDSLAIAESLLYFRGGIDFNHIKKVEPYVSSAINLFKKLNRKYETGVVLELNGLLLGNKLDFINAQKNFFEAYEIYSKLDSLNALGKICLNMGNNFAYGKDMKNSFFYYKKALAIGKQIHNYKIEANALMNLGINYRKTDVDTAMYYYNKALKVLTNKSEKKIKTMVLYNMANLESDRGNNIIAEKIYNEIKSNAISEKNYESLAVAYSGLSSIAINSGKSEESVRYLLKSIRIADSIGMKNLSMMLRPELISIYKNKGDYKKALTVTEELKTLSDSIFSKEKQIAINELDKKYKTKEKNQQIIHLKQASSLRQNIAIVLLFLSGSLFFMWYKKNKLHKEKTAAYSVLMRKYRDEKEKKQLKEINFSSTMNLNIKEKIDSKELFLFNKLNDYYLEEKPYLDSKLKIEQVAKKLNIPQRNLIAALRAGGYTSFTSYTNKFRIDEVKKLFEDPNLKHYKIEALALQAGFGAKQSFYNTFEKFTGVKPSYYRDEILKTDL
jgi:AraC-like DNA-binding protein